MTPVGSYGYLHPFSIGPTGTPTSVGTAISGGTALAGALTSSLHPAIELEIANHPRETQIAVQPRSDWATWAPMPQEGDPTVVLAVSVIALGCVIVVVVERSRSFRFSRQV